MEERTIKTIEYSVEALLIAWLGYLFFYQNYILYTWHRGLPLPSRLPFVVTGVVLAALFFWYEYRKMERELNTGGIGNTPLPGEAGDGKHREEQETQEEN